jgi:ferredoxin--NADP+ reductase
MSARDQRPFRIAIVGAGPAGVYAAGHVLEGAAGTYIDGQLVRLVDVPVEVDVLERLPTPWGLVRGAVAPDHPEKKLVTNVFEEIARRPGFRYFGNVEVGSHVRPAELAAWYDAVIYAVGCASDPHIGIPGEELPGCWAAREFVAWYNGDPDFSHLEFDLSCERAIVVGNGNVALDVARILACPVDKLARTDIADHALAALRASRIREIVILGRRGHLHAAFNNPELEELAELPGVDVIVDLDDLPGEHETVLDDADWTTLRKLQTLRRYAENPTSGEPRSIVLRFLTSPVELYGPDRVQAALCVRNHLERDATGKLQARPTEEESIIETGLVLRAIGYSGSPISGLPFDDHRGVIPNENGRVRDRDGVVRGAYVTGWIKRGPTGIIGTNKKCARDTVRLLVEDARTGRLPTRGTLRAEEVAGILAERAANVVTYDGWKAIDRHERRAGELAGRPRVKLTRREDMLRLATPAARRA